MIGLDIFKEYFRDYQSQYVLIGGAACDLIFEEQGNAFRATKDLDLVLSYIYLIPFKAKAWMELRERKAQGNHVDEKDIRKHKNDVLRLATLLTGTEHCELSEAVREDFAMFFREITQEPVALKALKIVGVTWNQLMENLSKVYLLPGEKLDKNEE